MNVYSNTGEILFQGIQVWSPNRKDTINVLENSGTLTIDYLIDRSSRSDGYVLGLTHVVNVQANTGTINLHDVIKSGLTGYGIDTQVNIGNNGSLANVQGTINLANQAAHYGLAVDAHNNSAPGPQWMVDASHAAIGDLALNYANINAPSPYLDTFSKLQLYPSAGSTVAITQELPFYRQEVHGAGGSNTLIGPNFGTFWSLTGIDSGFIAMVFPYQRQLDWTGVQSLVGGVGDDTFVFAAGSVTGLVNGGGGFNTLHYNLPPTPFTVDLANGVAPLVSGPVSNIQAVFPSTNAKPTLSINSVELAEGNIGTTSFVFTVTLSFDPTDPVTVTVNTTDGTATLADGDYEAVTNLVLTFNPGGPLAQSVTVLVKGDTKNEPNESLLVVLSGATGATIASGQGTGTILNDDVDVPPAPTLKIAGPAAGVRRKPCRSRSRSTRPRVSRQAPPRWPMRRPASVWPSIGETETTKRSSLPPATQRDPSPICIRPPVHSPSVPPLPPNPVKPAAPPLSRFPSPQ